MARLNEIELKELTSLTADQIEKLDYEATIRKLEVVVEALEQEGTALEIALKLYELGSALGKKCGIILDSTEERMIQLLGNVKDAHESPFDIEKDGRSN